MPDMKETIIFAPGLNGTELLRSLARFGCSTFGVRIANAVDLAGIALMKSGVSVTETFLPRKEEASLIDPFLREIAYFSNASYADAESMAASLYVLRSLIPENEEETIRNVLPKGEFPQKNEALISAYEKYMEALSRERRIDTVGLIRKAINEASPLQDEIITLKEYPLTALEERLMMKLSSGRFREMTLAELFRVSTAGLSEHLAITECYGASNEVRDILSYISDHYIPYDHCTIAVAETISYAGLFNDLSDEYGIPVSFGCGLPITVTNPARLLKLYQKWNTSGFRGIDALSELIFGSSFDRKSLQEMISPEKEIRRKTWKKIVEKAGSLRLSGDPKEDQPRLSKYAALIKSTKYETPEDEERACFVLSCLEKLSQIMEQGPVYLIRNFSKIREGKAGRFDRSAVSIITGMIETYQRFSDHEGIDELIPAILNKTIASENSREGTLYVCGIKAALAAPREYLFVAGLSSSHFPGSPSENYLLLDSDMRLLKENGRIPDSSSRVLEKKQALIDLLHEAASLGLKIRLSYSSYDLAGLKEENPSSVLYEIFQEAFPKETDTGAFERFLRHASYFDDGISRHSAAGKAYIEGSSICIEKAEAFAFHKASCDPLSGWAPSSIDQYFSCPRKFYLTKVLRIEEPESDDPFKVIDPRETGKMAHALMELLGRDHLQKAAFLKEAEKAFDEFLITRPPVHIDDGLPEKREFLRMMENAFDQDPGSEVLAAEEERSVLHSSSVMLKGIPDRVEKTEDGRYRIVDFKTGRKITHQKDDIDSCLQVLIYAYMMEAEGFEISDCEYRYLRSKSIVPCRYDDEMKEKLSLRLGIFREALENGDFPCTQDEEECYYCRLKAVCGRQRKEEGEEESNE